MSNTEKTFSPPSVSEVIDYAALIGFSKEEAVEFHYLMSMGEWKAKRGKDMSNWKLAFRAYAGVSPCIGVSGALEEEDEQEEESMLDAMSSSMLTVPLFIVCGALSACLAYGVFKLLF